MATITVSEGSQIQPISCVGEIKHYKEGASQTFKRGYPLIFSSVADKEDRVIEAGADPGAIIGFAAEDASGTEDTLIAVYVANDDLRVRVHVGDTQTVDVDMLKAAGFGIVKDATNKIWRLDKTETTAKIFKVRGLVDAHDDVNGAVIASVLSAERENEL